MKAREPYSSLVSLIRLLSCLGLASSFLAAELVAQSSAVRFRHLSVEDGLSHDSVYSVIQDARGFMWFATEDGLDRYDGYSFVHFHRDRLAERNLSIQNANYVFESSAGNIWIGTWGGGLDRLDPHSETSTHFRHDPEDAHSLSDNRIQTIFETQAVVIIHRA